MEKNGGRTAVGVSGVPQRRFRGVIRFLEAYATGEDTDYDGRPADVGVPQFIRYCVDDLKAFYYEARMEQRPGMDDGTLHDWYWGETAMSGLIVSWPRLWTSRTIRRSRPSHAGWRGKTKYSPSHRPSPSRECCQIIT